MFSISSEMRLSIAHASQSHGTLESRILQFKLWKVFLYKMRRLRTCTTYIRPSGVKQPMQLQCIKHCILFSLNFMSEKFHWFSFCGWVLLNCVHARMMRPPLLSFKFSPIPSGNHLFVSQHTEKIWSGICLRCYVMVCVCRLCCIVALKVTHLIEGEHPHTLRVTRRVCDWV